jgi:hypothetical protein
MARRPLENPLTDHAAFPEPDPVSEPGKVPESGKVDVAAEQPVPASDAFALNIEDLLPASDGSVIFDADVPVSVELAAGRSVVDSGTAGEAAQAGGVSVAGYRYVALDDGLTLFYPPDSALVVVDG